MSEKIFLGSNVGELETGDVPANITRVNLSVDSDHYYTAGDDTGRAIEVTCPWGSQEMANSILASVSGKTYQPYTATDALLDPAAEIGDAVTVGGYYSVIADISTSFDRASAPTISAPGSDEIDDEYPYESRERRETNRQLAQTRSLISKTSKKILLQVENELEGLSSSFSVQLDNITGRVNGLDGEFKEFSLTLDGLTVTDSTGKTVINGSMIQTSNLYVNAANISGTLTANQINLTGAITWGDLDSSIQNDINDAYSMAEDAQDVVGGWTYRGTTYIDGSKIMAGTVMASILQGGTVELLDRNEDVSGSISIRPASTSDEAIRIESEGGMALDAVGGTLYLESRGRIILNPETEVDCQADLIPGGDNRYALGYSQYRWTDVYAVNGAIQTSDANQKNSIEPLPAQYVAMLDQITPKRYKLNDGQSGRYHVGFIAQDVEAAMAAAGITDMEFAGWIRDVDADGNEVYMLRYNEFMAILLAKIKSLEQKLTTMEGTS